MSIISCPAISGIGVNTNPANAQYIKWQDALDGFGLQSIFWAEPGGYTHGDDGNGVDRVASFIDQKNGYNWNQATVARRPRLLPGAGPNGLDGFRFDRTEGNRLDPSRAGLTGKQTRLVLVKLYVLGNSAPLQGTLLSGNNSGSNGKNIWRVSQLSASPTTLSHNSYIDGISDVEGATGSVGGGQGIAVDSVEGSVNMWLAFDWDPATQVPHVGYCPDGNGGNFIWDDAPAAAGLSITDTAIYFGASSSFADAINCVLSGAMVFDGYTLGTNSDMQDVMRAAIAGGNSMTGFN